MTNTTFNTLPDITSKQVIPPEALLRHWQGHRLLTRRVIEAFPEEHLFAFAIGGMRPFALMAMEMIGLASSGIKGIATGSWHSLQELFHHSDELKPATQTELLQLWDEVTFLIDTFWPQIPARHFQEMVSAFGQYEGRVYELILYWIDNEVHHRGQGYVYLRSLGIEPPAFWDR
jgi:uncharacterized damage-inducible protein DinB